MAISLDDLIKKVEKSEISSIKSVLMKIIEITSDSNSCIWELKNVIEMDPPLAARVMKLANSAYYGRTRKLEEIVEAIILIGFESIKEIAVSQKVCHLFANDKERHGYSRATLWRHSVAVALCSKLLFRRKLRRMGGEVYIAGLLHDIGIIIVDQYAHGDFDKVLVKVANENINIQDAMHERLGYNQCDVAQRLTQTWNFPENMCAALGEFCHVDKVHREKDLLAAVLFITKYACFQRNIGYAEWPAVEQETYLHLLGLLKITETSMDAIMEEIENDLFRMQKNGWF